MPCRSSANRSAIPTVYGDDRVFLSQVPIDELEAAGHPVLVGGSDASAHGVGHLVVTMELAVALTGAAIGVQPFDQPDVAAAKAATNEVLDSGALEVPAARSTRCSRRCARATTSPSRSSAIPATTRPTSSTPYASHCATASVSR